MRSSADNAEHPPLGRWLLGLASTVAQPLEILVLGGPDPVGTYVVAARLAPALSFAILVGLVTHTAARRWGCAAGAVAGLSLLAMPRVFAHAHLAALDTFLSLFWVLALLAAEGALGHRRPFAASVGAGVALGLALLTKIHAWFLLPDRPDLGLGSPRRPAGLGGLGPVGGDRLLPLLCGLALALV